MDQLEQKLKEYEEKKKQAEVEKITKLQKVRELLKNKNNSSSDIHPASIKSEELDKIVSNVASQSGEISILNNSLKNDLENLNKYQKTVAKKNFRIKKASFWSIIGSILLLACAGGVVGGVALITSTIKYIITTDDGLTTLNQVGDKIHFYLKHNNTKVGENKINYVIKNDTNKYTTFDQESKTLTLTSQPPRAIKSLIINVEAYFASDKEQKNKLATLDVTIAPQSVYKIMLTSQEGGGGVIKDTLHGAGDRIYLSAYINNIPTDDVRYVLSENDYCTYDNATKSIILNISPTEYVGNIEMDLQAINDSGNWEVVDSAYFTIIPLDGYTIITKNATGDYTSQLHKASDKLYFYFYINNYEWTFASNISYSIIWENEDEKENVSIGYDEIVGRWYIVLNSEIKNTDPVDFDVVWYQDDTKNVEYGRSSITVSPSQYSTPDQSYSFDEPTPGDSHTFEILKDNSILPSGEQTHIKFNFNSPYLSNTSFSGTNWNKAILSSEQIPTTTTVVEVNVSFDSSPLFTIYISIFKSTFYSYVNDGNNFFTQANKTYDMNTFDLNGNVNGEVTYILNEQEASNWASISGDVLTIKAIPFFGQGPFQFNIISYYKTTNVELCRCSFIVSPSMGEGTKNWSGSDWNGYVSGQASYIKPDFTPAMTGEEIFTGGNSAVAPGKLTLGNSLSSYVEIPRFIAGDKIYAIKKIQSSNVIVRGNLTIPDSVETIVTESFANNSTNTCDLSSVTFGSRSYSPSYSTNNIQYLQSNIFKGNTNLKTINWSGDDIFPTVNIDTFAGVPAGGKLYVSGGSASYGQKLLNHFITNGGLDRTWTVIDD